MNKHFDRVLTGLRSALVPLIAILVMAIFIVIAAFLFASHYYVLGVLSLIMVFVTLLYMIGLAEESA